MCARAQAKAGNAREDSLSEEQCQVYQALAGRLQSGPIDRHVRDRDCL